MTRCSLVQTGPFVGYTLSPSAFPSLDNDKHSSSPRLMQHVSLQYPLPASRSSLPPFTSHKLARQKAPATLRVGLPCGTHSKQAVLVEQKAGMESERESQRGPYHSQKRMRKEA